jgi:hypothetical protein
MVGVPCREREGTGEQRAVPRICCAPAHTLGNTELGLDRKEGSLTTSPFRESPQPSRRAGTPEALRAPAHQFSFLPCGVMS